MAADQAAFKDFHKAYLKGNKANVILTDAGNADINTLAESLTVSAGQDGICAGVQWESGGSTCTVYTGKSDTGTELAAAGSATANTNCYVRKQVKTANAAHKNFVETYLPLAKKLRDGDAAAVKLKAFLEATGGTALQTAAREKELYAQLKSKTNARKAAWDAARQALGVSVAAGGAINTVSSTAATALSTEQTAVSTKQTAVDTKTAAKTTAQTKLTQIQDLKADWTTAEATATAVELELTNALAAAGTSLTTATATLGDAGSGATKASADADALVTTRETELTAATTAQTTAEAALTAPLAERAGLVTKVADEEVKVAAAWTKLQDNVAALNTAVADVATKAAAFAAAETKCKSDQFDKFKL